MDSAKCSSFNYKKLIYILPLFSTFVFIFIFLFQFYKIFKEDRRIKKLLKILEGIKEKYNRLKEEEFYSDISKQLSMNLKEDVKLKIKDCIKPNETGPGVFVNKQKLFEILNDITK